jgi:hypothetical protein
MDRESLIFYYTKDINTLLARCIVSYCESNSLVLQDRNLYSLWTVMADMNCWIQFPEFCCDRTSGDPVRLTVTGVIALTKNYVYREMSCRVVSCRVDWICRVLWVVSLCLQPTIDCCHGLCFIYYRRSTPRAYALARENKCSVYSWLWARSIAGWHRIQGDAKDTRQSICNNTKAASSNSCTILFISWVLSQKLPLAGNGWEILM